LSEAEFRKLFRSFITRESSFV